MNVISKSNNYNWKCSESTYLIIFAFINLLHMQVSIQTDRRKKPELAPLPNLNGLPEVEEEGEKEKERKIKKLTLINKELIETLKRQNEELTRKINKQKLKVGRSVQRTESPGRNHEKEKTELANAYKQIEMYKTVLKDLKAKEISSESADKLSALENKIHYEDSTIEKLQKELKYIKNIKEQQEKELHLYENQDVKASVGELEEELKQMKEKLKLAKKQTKKREEMALKQHGYFMELEKTLRKHNDEYYPGATTTLPKQKKNEPTIYDGQEITEREWQVVRAQLAELKRIHDENNKKIEQLTRNRNKQIKSLEDNELKLKDKQRKLQTVKAKVAELAKLVNSEKDKEDKKEVSVQRVMESNDDDGSQYEGVMQNGKKVYKAKNPENEREVKRWIIPQGYVQQRGKILPDSIFFSDKLELRSTRKSKIIRIQVWTDSAGTPATLQFHYQGDEGKIIPGILAYSLGELQDYEDKVIEFKQGDYLCKIVGKLQGGYVSTISFISKFGKKQTFNELGSGQEFKLQPRPNEIPTGIFGAYLRDERDFIRLCHIGCEFISDW